jgi:hypothetical protein
MSAFYHAHNIVAKMADEAGLEPADLEHSTPITKMVPGTRLDRRE